MAIPMNFELVRILEITRCNLRVVKDYITNLIPFTYNTRTSTNLP